MNTVYYTTTFIMLFLIGCDNRQNANRNVAIEDDIELTDSITVESTTETENKRFYFDINDITELIDSVFKIETSELQEAKASDRRNFFEFTDSSQVQEFKRYWPFLIIKYQDSQNSKNEFAKIKSLAEDLKARKSLASTYDRILSKGGVTYVQVDKWIIVHFLRCNMTPDEYQVNKEFITSLEDLFFDVDWITSYCGWGKMEIKNAA